MAINNAASKYKPVPILMLYKTISAITLIYIVSRAKTLSGIEGP
jgi:hypothetical protein